MLGKEACHGFRELSFKLLRTPDCLPFGRMTYCLQETEISTLVSRWCKINFWWHRKLQSSAWNFTHCWMRCTFVFCCCLRSLATLRPIQYQESFCRPGAKCTEKNCNLCQCVLQSKLSLVMGNQLSSRPILNSFLLPYNYILSHEHMEMLTIRHLRRLYAESFKKVFHRLREISSAARKGITQPAG